MTATFGKLEHQTLTLQPGLNIIEAPNEWGKSTWCAFLVNMLYGIDTRARSTGAALADKERYAPWSGSAMSGRIDLCWNGRDITIERTTRGRVIFGEFKAYETHTGLEVPELNSLNCGQVLLGVERSVFTRAGFLKHSDLPVTHDDSLRRRLNNLVTTGDESDSGDKLAQKLKDLKNKCRHNRTGLLPQAETERDQIQAQLHELQELTQRIHQFRDIQAQLEGHIDQLENHADALRYAASLEDGRRVEEAFAAAEQAKQRLEATMDACRELPSQEEARRKLQTAQSLQEQWMALQAEAQMLPPMPEKPQIPAWYQGVEAAQADAQRNAALEKSKKKNGLIIAVCCALAAAAAVCGVLMPQLMLYMVIAAAVILVTGIVLCISRASRIYKALLQLYDRYPGIPAKDWVALAQNYADQLHAYELLRDNAAALRASVDQRTAAVQSDIAVLTQGDALTVCQSRWAQTVTAWEALADARRDLAQAQGHAQTLQAMAKTVQPPKAADDLTYSEEQTQAILAEARLKLREVHSRLGQYQGQAEALGSEAQLRARLDTLNRRIARLEDTYYALELAQDALHNATQQLQRRFAPRISKRAQELFGQLTGGRYQRLALGSDFTVSTSAEGEDTLHTAQWRSDGTADQLYFALRLAVSEELTPEAPLVLDDALVCFDDTRLQAAMGILQDAAQHKQVILFTCQGREKALFDAQ
jgi:uncharacterized protein YhaN